MSEIIDKTKGKVKQAVGKMTGNKRLKREGRMQGQVEVAVQGRIRN